MKLVMERYIDAAFTALGSLVQDATYKCLSDYQHDAQTYELIQAFEEIPVRCIFTSFKRHELDSAVGDIMASDKKILIPRKYLSGEVYNASGELFSGEIKTGDEITSEMITFTVIDVGTDPTQATYQIQGRA